MSTTSMLPTQQVLSVVPGLASQVFIHHGWRDAKVLAILGQEVLIEYQMPRFSGLRILDLGTAVTEECADSYVGVLGRDTNVHYERLSVQWLRAIVEAKQEWIATPLRRAGTAREPLPPAEVVLQRRTAGTYPS